ncbi:MAG: M23 family metallopeptidase [Spirochaetia bacterium]
MKKSFILAAVIFLAFSCSSGEQQNQDDNPEQTRKTPVIEYSEHYTPEPHEPRYVFPVQPADITSYVFEHHDYPATDIFAPEGTPVVAVTDGVVEWAKREDIWDPMTNLPEERGGVSFSIIGTDGWRYYGSHLQSLVPWITEGYEIRAGELIGYVGGSGNARNTPPHIHFGISRPTTPDDWVTRRGQIWPYPYLQDWESWENTVPE